MNAEHRDTDADVGHAIADNRHAAAVDFDARSAAADDDVAIECTSRTGDNTVDAVVADLGNVIVVSLDVREDVRVVQRTQTLTEAGDVIPLGLYAADDVPPHDAGAVVDAGDIRSGRPKAGELAVEHTQFVTAVGVDTGGLRPDLRFVDEQIAAVLREQSDAVEALRRVERRRGLAALQLEAVDRDIRTADAEDVREDRKLADRTWAEDTLVVVSNQQRAGGTERLHGLRED